MNWLKKAFSASVGVVIKEAGDALDKIFTSDEQRIKANAILADIHGKLELAAMDAAAKFEQEVTKRHAADMSSDSWLSKNIRPLTLAFSITMTIALVWATVFSDLKEHQVTALQAWIPLLTAIDLTAIGFYFGSRGVEKGVKIWRYRGPQEE